MSEPSKFTFYSPLISMFLLVFVALFIHPPGEAFEPKSDLSVDTLGIIFLVLGIADVVFVPKLFMPQVLAASSKQEVLSTGLIPVTTSVTPLILGFVHYFLFANLLYFIPFVILSLLSWLYYYKQIEAKLESV